ncbi:MAG TPA: hypothetical protein VMY39_05375, partial [Planctomycetota bacterium]|nr:hypothetical protein [Planctomycetota bacterium]
MLSRRAILIVALCLAASTPAAGADTVTRIDGEAVVGEVTRVDSKTTVDVRSASGVVRVPSSEVLSVRFGGRDWNSPGPVDLVVLSSGERWLVALERDVKAKLGCAGGKLLEGRNVVAFGDVRAWVPRLGEGFSDAEREKLPV